MTGKIIPTYDYKKATEGYLLVIAGQAVKWISQGDYNCLPDYDAPVKSNRRRPIKSDTPTF